ncbi:MAG: DUF6602 domain-containing protein [Acidobacteriota bacterium]
MADSGQIDISEVFRRVQHEMLARLTTVRLFEHPTTNGTASELQWLDLLATYLPKRYRASPAFIINAQGQRSRQIDIAIYDQLNSPPIFPHAAGVHIPIECVYAVFEVKSNMNPKTLRDAGEKAGSVRALAGPRAGKILAGILSTRAHWGSRALSCQPRPRPRPAQYPAPRHGLRARAHGFRNR